MRLNGAIRLGTAAISAFALAACNDTNSTITDLASASAGPQAEKFPSVQNWSVTPALVKNLMGGVQAYTILGSDDELAGSPNYIFGGSADGAALTRSRGDGTYTLLVNHEDNFSVSRVTLDRNMKPIKGEYLINSDIGRFRLCSATLATPEVHGFGPVFLSAGESSIESVSHALDPFGAVGNDKLLPALGHWNAENLVPLPKQTFPGRTVIAIGDDDSGINGGQFALYVSDKVGDLDSGRLYVLAPAAGTMIESSITVGQDIPVVFRQIEGQTQMTGAQIDARAAALGAFQFGRVEDIDYRKGSNWANGTLQGREIFFIVTGQDYTGANADHSRSKYGRVYRLLLDAKDPLKGTLSVVLNGDDRTGPAGTFQNPDGILVTENYFYVGEDPNGYGDETHDAYLYQYNIASGQLNVVTELDHQRTAVDADRYNVGGTSRFGSWEYGSVTDVTDLLGSPNGGTTLMVAIQPHTWTGAKYRAPDGGATRANEQQASQMILLTGLPR